MNINPLLLLGGLGLLLLGSKAVAKKTMSKVMSFTLNGVSIDWKKLKISITMGVQNPSSGSAKLNSLVGSLFVDKKEVATITSFTPVQIQANQVTILKLDLKPSLVGIFGSLKKIIKSKGNSLKNLGAEFRGNANVDGFTFPVNTVLA